MKKVLFLATFILLANSCVNRQLQHEQEKKEEQRKEDSIKQARAIDLAHKNDSLSNYAWGDIKFGSSLNEVLKSEAFKGASKGKYDDGDTYLSLYFENFKLSKHLGLQKFGEVRARFESDQLIQIYIRSVGADPQDFFKINEDCEILYKQFYDKYGEPGEYCGGNLRSIDIVDNKSTTYARWQISSKSIRISVIDEYASYDYTYEVYINNFRYPKNVTPSKEEQEKKQKAAKEKQKAIKNAF